MDCLTTSQDLLSNKKYKKSNGFSMLEILLCTILISVLAIGLSSNMVSSLVVSADNNEVLKANNLAKAYIKDQELKWFIQKDYDISEMVSLNSTYTNSANFVVTNTIESLAVNDSNQTIIRRLKLNYKNKKGELLSSVFYDFNRPGSLSK